ncbi:SDR family oxidoreductase [Nocardia sp. alder85J]|uniref:SDR family oxidoreductase n=1 Tax=Nocardia sp. alder85J TaxID=2862949 RepID=UPI001CD4B012|nr:SDR family oxidoreductase [Nocardia sp. alder85J]MCX4094204.1 SDR family oxidoreductase [Nocardia sp. alder85J]
MTRFVIAGKVVVVTGGARGIGRAVAAALRKQGAQVAIGDIDTVTVKTAAGDLGILGDTMDVTDPASVTAFLELVQRELGPVDIWINNAGIMPIGPVLEQSDALVRRCVDINVHGVINGSRAAARAMTGRGGRIVNIASIAGRIPAPGMALYNATKFAVVGFSEALDAELAARDIRVSVVLPSFTATELISGISINRLSRPVAPEQIAAAVVAVLTGGRRQAVIPRSLAPSAAVWAMLPRPVTRFLRRVAGFEEAFLHSDGARAAYDARIAGE